ncbi:MAG: glycogen synthase, partial [Spirochaetaceae bacterium]
MPDVKKPAKLKICMICSEAHPIVKVGGLGDAVPALARELRAHGMDIRLLIPNYQDGQAQVRARIPLPPIKLGRHSFPAALLETNIGDVPVYLLDIPVLYDRPGVYGPRIDQAHHDNLLRFGALAAAVFPACRALNWQPDIIHGHDWQACLSPCLADLEPDFAGTPQVITIHNIGYQGDFPLHQMDDLGVEAARAIQCGLLLHGKINLLAGGIVHANAVTTVSAQYAQEIQGELGYGLQGIIQARRDDLYGIMNGMDYDEWNPATDPHLAQNFDYNSPQVFADKAINKTALQKELGLPLDKD